jgi:hypothetical protein
LKERFKASYEILDMEKELNKIEGENISLKKSHS